CGRSWGWAHGIANRSAVISHAPSSVATNDPPDQALAVRPGRLHHRGAGRPRDRQAFRAQRLAKAFEVNAKGKLRYPELVYSAPKKSGKTALAAMVVLTVTLILGGRYGEAYCVANDWEQAVSRVFAAIRRIVEASPALRDAATVTQSRITFGELGATIEAIASDYAGAAGANPVCVSFDELWGYTSERSQRLWDELVPPPTRKISCRLVTTYAGWEGESLLLERLYKRGLQQPLAGKDLYAG